MRNSLSTPSFVNRWATRLVACLAMGAMLAPAARAAEDTSTPKKAAVAFAKAVQSGDMTAVKALSTGSDAEYAMIKQISDMFVATKNLEAAAVKKFGDEAKLPKEMSMDMASEFEGSDEKIEGDTATLVSKGKPDDKFPPTLKKSGDGWKLDLSNLSKDPSNAQMLQMMAPMTKAMDTVTKNINDGKYKAASDVYADLGAQIAAAATPAAEPPK